MDEVKRKVYLDIFASPTTLLPMVGGISALMASWAMNGNATLNFAGVTGILMGAGVLVTRLIVGLESLTERAYDHLLQRQRQQQEQALEHLHQRLIRDQDPRTQNSLHDLQHLYKQLKEKTDRGDVNAAAFEVVRGVDELFQSCVNQLEHSVELWETASKLRGPAREEMLRQRSQLVDEICDTVIHLGKTVDKFHAVTTNKNRSELARLRSELDRSMEIAKEVERRTDQLTHHHDYNDQDLE